jgi:putative phosphoesterase
VHVGVVSDTHGYLDPRLAAALAGVEAILHAGDVGSRTVLEALEGIAPVYAVRGNNDDKLGGLGLPSHADVTLGGVRIHIVHQLPHARPPEGTGVVVFGHSHRTLVEDRDGVLYLNPGAAGRAGFHRLQTVAVLDCTRGRASGAHIIELGAREEAARAKRRSV